VSVSQPSSTNMAGGKVVIELFSFKAKDSFMVLKQKVHNLTHLAFQARQKEMGAPSAPQKRTDTHLPVFTPRHLAGQETLLGIVFKQIQT